MFWNKKKAILAPVEEPVKANTPDLKVTYIGFRDKADVFLDVSTDKNNEESVIGLAKMIATIFTSKTQALTVETVKKGLIMNGRGDLADVFINEIIRNASSDFDAAKNEAYFSEPCVKPSDLTR